MDWFTIHWYTWPATSVNCMETSVHGVQYHMHSAGRPASAWKGIRWPEVCNWVRLNSNNCSSWQIGWMTKCMCVGQIKIKAGICWSVADPCATLKIFWTSHMVNVDSEYANGVNWPGTRLWFVIVTDLLWEKAVWGCTSGRVARRVFRVVQ